MRAQTRTELVFAKRRLSEPPLFERNEAGQDRVETIGRLLDLPGVLAAACDAGRVVYGEIGRTKPDARTVPAADGYICEINSGMMDFLYAVARAASGLSVVYRVDGTAKNVQAKSKEEVSELLRSTFRQWRAHCTPNLFEAFWKQARIEHAKFVVHQAAGGRAESVATWAEAFVLAHELGHAALNLKLVESPQPSEELRADSVGFDIFFGSRKVQEDVRMALGGMCVAIRVIECLEKIGVKFARVYPAAAIRLEMLLSRLRRKSPSQQYFDEINTIVVAHLGMFDSLDDLIGKTTKSVAGGLWQRRVGLIAALQFLVTENRPNRVWTGAFERETVGLSAADQQLLARDLQLYYADTPSQESFYVEPCRLRMGEAMRRCVPELPEPLRRLFSNSVN